MAIVQRGENIFLVRVYHGRDRVTKKRLQKNVTVYGTREDAEKQEQLLKEKAARGELSKSPIRTVGQLMSAYLNSSRHRLDITSKYMMQATWDRYVAPYIGSFKIDEISTNDIQKYFNFLLDPKKEDINGRD
jgi:Phage integrase, N-terminal SAM-like domain